MVVHCASNRAKAEETRKLIEEKGGKAAVVTGDLTDPCTAERLMAENGPLDALVLDASMQIRRPWQKISLEEYQKQMTCNFYSSLRLIQLAVPHMKAQKWGRIVTIGSVQERKPHPDMLVYSASKAAQTNMVQSLAQQLAADGITVNNVAPRGDLYRPQRGGAERPDLRGGSDGLHSRGFLWRAAGLRWCGAAVSERRGPLHHRPIYLCGWGKEPVIRTRPVLPFPPGLPWQKRLALPQAPA